METKLIDFCGGPGAGKSTMAYQLFGWMKKNQYSVAFAPEFATELCWQDRKKELTDQIYLLGEQHHRIYNLLGQVDYIVSDTSLALTLHYVKNSFDKYPTDQDLTENIRWTTSALAMYLHQYFNPITFYIDRKQRKFTPKGRAHTEEQANKFDGDIKEVLDNHAFGYTIVHTLDEVLKELNFVE
jgi:hypothetical protein